MMNTAATANQTDERINHDYDAFPTDYSICPCDECLDRVEREHTAEIQAVWPHPFPYIISVRNTEWNDPPCVVCRGECGDAGKSTKDGVGSSLGDGMGVAVNTKAPAKKTIIRKGADASERTIVVVNFYTNSPLGGSGIIFRHTGKLHIHRGCVPKEGELLPSPGLDEYDAPWPHPRIVRLFSAEPTFGPRLARRVWGDRSGDIDTEVDADTPEEVEAGITDIDIDVDGVDVDDSEIEIGGDE